MNFVKFIIKLDYFSFYIFYIYKILKDKKLTVMSSIKYLNFKFL